jgi:hypothetical protein
MDGVEETLKVVSFCNTLERLGWLGRLTILSLAHRLCLSLPRLSQVIKLMQSFTSKELVKEQFSWRYYYWYLTNEAGGWCRFSLHVILHKSSSNRLTSGYGPWDSSLIHTWE